MRYRNPRLSWPFGLLSSGSIEPVSGRAELEGSTRINHLRPSGVSLIDGEVSNVGAVSKHIDQSRLTFQNDRSGTDSVCLACPTCEHCKHPS